MPRRAKNPSLDDMSASDEAGLMFRHLERLKEAENRRHEVAIAKIMEASRLLASLNEGPGVPPSPRPTEPATSGRRRSRIVNVPATSNPDRSGWQIAQEAVLSQAGVFRNSDIVKQANHPRVTGRLVSKLLYTLSHGKTPKIKVDEEAS